MFSNMPTQRDRGLDLINGTVQNVEMLKASVVALKIDCKTLPLVLSAVGANAEVLEALDFMKIGKNRLYLIPRVNRRENLLGALSEDLKLRRLIVRSDGEGAVPEAVAAPPGAFGATSRPPREP